MILVFLHGAPATGKYTVGRTLASLTGYELFHNHVVVDEVLKSHPFGTPEFVAERDRRWREYFAASSNDPSRRVIFTFNPESTVPQSFVDWLFNLSHRGNVLHSVALTASESTIEKRLGSEQRQQFGKLTDVNLYRRLRRERTFSTPSIPRTDLTLDTELLPPAESANRVVRRFNLV